MADLLTGKPTNSTPDLHPDLKALLLVQKTELINEITRATANQFNNMMMAITSYAELEMKKATPSQRKGLEQVLSNAGQATALVQRLLAISRKQPASPRSLDLNKVLTEISNLIEQLAGDNVSFSHNLDPGIPMVNADPAEVEQVVLALAINARNGMAQGGKLTASTRLVDLHKDSIGAGEIERPGKYVMLAIDDTGCDRTTEDPVSNRDQDGRINLSLAAVRGIIKNAGGYVRFSTEPGKGNSFTIYFPALEQEAEKAFRGSSLRTVPIARTVLVVEDDDAVRIPTSEFLKMEGFKVLQAKTGDEAIHLVQQNRSRVDVLVTDLVMPRMTGREVAEKLIDLHPELKVLYMSGDTDQTHSSRARALPVDAVLRKPFRLETLKGRIHELLGE